MADGLAKGGSPEKPMARDRKKIICKPGSRLFSDVETAAAPSLQFGLQAEVASSALSHSIRGLKGVDTLLLPAYAALGPSWGSRGTGITGNIFVDHRRYSFRRLEGLLELQHCREASLLIDSFHFWQAPSVCSAVAGLR